MYIVIYFSKSAGIYMVTGIEVFILVLVFIMTDIPTSTYTTF